MSDNFHGLDEEEVEQDEMKAKLDLITVASARNLDDIYNAIVNNSTVTTLHSANFGMTNASTLRTYAEDNRTTITTNTAAIAGLTSGLFSDAIRFSINGGYEYSGLTNGTFRSSSFILLVAHRRYVLVRDDTYSSDVVLANNNTTFTPNSSGNYLSIITAEIYDNVAAAKQINLELYGHTEGASLQMIRHTMVGSSTNYEYNRIHSVQVVPLVAGQQYYYKAYSTNGAVINSLSTFTNFLLIKMEKSF